VPKAFFKSINLLGDGLNIRPALAAWMADHPDYDVDILTLPDHIACIYDHMDLPLRVITDESQKESSYDFEHTFDCGDAYTVGEHEHIHEVQAYAKLLGYEIKQTSQQDGKNPDPDFKPSPLVFTPQEDEHESGLVLISPFSRSCSSQDGKGNPPNKMLPWHHWTKILMLLRTYGKIGVLGATDDRAPNDVPIGEEEYFCGLPLNRVALMLRDCRMLITIDSGVAHLAATQQTTGVELYPTCLSPSWAVPWESPNMMILTMNPAAIFVAQTTHGLRTAIDMLIARGKIKSNLFSG
jgi:ADP-heptose:LPS heptosyltransferase